MPLFSTEKTSVIPSVFLFLKNKHKILMARRYNTGYGDGFYSFVAGHVEKDETFKQAMIREAKEEVGISIKEEALQIVHIMHRYVVNEKNRIDIFMTTHSWAGELYNAEPHKCDQIEWFSLEAIPRNTLSYIKHAIQQINKNIWFSEFDFPD